MLVTPPVSLAAKSSMPMRTRSALSATAQVWPGWSFRSLLLSSSKRKATATVPGMVKSLMVLPLCKIAGWRGGGC
jgi:hypothetical protein